MQTLVMPEIKFSYQGFTQIAQVELKFENENIRTFIITLPNGKQAFIKQLKTAGIFTQEKYTEHEIWPAILIHSIKDALKLNFA
jgi:hypothetical protein